MIRAITMAGVVLLSAATVTAPLCAQQRSRPLKSPAAAPFDTSDTAGWRPLRIAKWGTLGGSAAAVLYGFVQSGRADDAFDALERTCEAEPLLCVQRTSDGQYADPELAAQRREARRLDRRARTALVAGQIGIAASIVLFLLDLGEERGTPDIPYRPPRLRVGPTPDGLELRVRLPLGRQPTS